VARLPGELSQTTKLASKMPSPCPALSATTPSLAPRSTAVYLSFKLCLPPNASDDGHRLLGSRYLSILQRPRFHAGSRCFSHSTPASA